MGSKKDGEGFETLYRLLEETVAKLEQGNLTLDESITLYEEGVRLALLTQKLLGDAELRITRLHESFTGSQTIREESAEYEPGANSRELPAE